MADDMKTTLEKVWEDANTAQSKAATAYDQLVLELDKSTPVTDEVVKQAGMIWLNSLRFAAEIWLSPTKIASSIAADDA